MRYLNRTEAGKLARVSRGTIANRIADGVLSCGPEGIDPAELARVFPDIPGDSIDRYLATGAVPDDDETGTVAATADRLPDGAAALAAHVAWLQGLVDDQRATIARKDAELRDALADAEERAARREAALSRQVDQLTALLPAPVATERRGLLRRLFG